MAKTFTEQCHVPPTSTNNLAADGEGVHTYFPFDFIRGANNLGTYVNNHHHYVQGSDASVVDSKGRVQVVYTDVASERFMLEIPVLVPMWAARLVWTVGAKCFAVSLGDVKVYASKQPYVGDASIAFQTTALDPRYQTRSVTLSLSAGSYGLADDSTTGIADLDSACQMISTGVGFQTKRLTYVVVTATGGINATLEIHDVSVWFLPS